MKARGTFARLVLVSCASAGATALISPLFSSHATAMLTDLPALADPDSPPVPPVANPRPARPALGSARSNGRPPAIIRRVDNGAQQIAFTFDACATRSQANGFDRAVFQVLQRERVPATIFTSGRWVEFHPDAMKELTAEPLIEFANHSYDHPHMAQLTSEAIAAEIDQTEAALGRYGRQSVAFRPPFGDFNDLVLQVVHAKHLPAVLWDVVSGDPSARATADAMIRSVVRQTRPGSIIIFHINARETKTADALPVIFRQLRARGFQFVHLSALLAGGTPVFAAPPSPVAVPAPAKPAAPRPATEPPPPALYDDDVMPPSPAETLSSVEGPEARNLKQPVTPRRARPSVRPPGEARVPLSLLVPAVALGPASAGATPGPARAWGGASGLRNASAITATFK